MKQFLLILTLILSLSSCLDEGTNGCPDYLRLTFLYGNTTRGYDEVIGNDIHLRLYKDGLIHSETIIPYQEIEGGQEYLIRKEATGQMDIIAWAIPAGEDFVASIPDVPQSGTRSGERLVMQALSRRLVHESMGHLYLGAVNYIDSDISQEIRAEIPMNSCIAQFTAALHTEAGSTDTQEEIWLEIHGTKSEMDVDFQPLGEDALIVAPFTHQDEDGVLRTELHGLLPSPEDSFISVKAYKQGVHLFTITTNQKSQPGDIIHLDIYSKYVTILINDWRVMDASVEWI